MKIIVKSVGIFLITFLIGTTVYFLIPKTETKIQVQQIIVESPILPEVSVEKVEPKIQPKVFNVENLWNDGNINRDFLEVCPVSNVKDIKAKSGETWFGLFSENGNEILRSTTLKVKTSREDGLDWKEISINEKPKPLFLVKNKKLKSGKIETLFRGKLWEEIDKYDNELTKLNNGFSKKFYLNDTEYTLRTEKGISTEKKNILVLFLETKIKSQIIYYIESVDEITESDYVGNLFWVGDLDRDGKLDLYMDFWNYEKGYSTSGLFLSSKAEKGKLVKMSRYLMFGGC